jgi:hypothetical protein
MRSRRIVLAATAVLAMGVNTACQDNRSTSPPTRASVQQPTPTPQIPGSTRLKEGTAPMSYALAAGGNIRIVDKTSRQLLAKKTVNPQTIIRIDQSDGVYAGREQLVKGPLNKGHRFEIWLDR